MPNIKDVLDIISHAAYVTDVASMSHALDITRDVVDVMGVISHAAYVADVASVTCAGYNDRCSECNGCSKCARCNSSRGRCDGYGKYIRCS